MLTLYTWKSKESWYSWTCVCFSCGSCVMLTVVEAKPFIAVKIFLNPFNLQLSHLSLLQETKFPQHHNRAAEIKLEAAGQMGCVQSDRLQVREALSPIDNGRLFDLVTRLVWCVFKSNGLLKSEREKNLHFLSLSSSHHTLTEGSRSTFTLPSNVICLVHDNVNSRCHTDSDIFQSNSGLF